MGRYRARRIPERVNNPDQMAIRSMKSKEQTAVTSGLATGIVVLVGALVIGVATKMPIAATFIGAGCFSVVLGAALYFAVRPRTKSAPSTREPPRDTVESLYRE